MIGLARPWLLLLLLLLPWWWRRWKREQTSPARVSQVTPFLRAPSRLWRLRLPIAFRSLAISFFVLAAAGPIRPGDRVRVNSEGISIILVLDISSSMLANDFPPYQRIDVARQQAVKFVQGRRNDQIGLVIFAGEALTKVPATLDYPTLINAINNVQVMELGEDGTAIGSGLATAVSRLRMMPGKEKVVLLLTDGANNRGMIDPLTAAETAQAYGVRVYTIGMGNPGAALQSLDHQSQFPADFDENLLREIAARTGGEYFQAGDIATMQQVFSRIDQLERTPIEAVRYIRYRESIQIPVLLGLLALVLEMVISLRWVVRVP